MRISKLPYPIRNINDKLYQIIAEYSIDRVKDIAGIKDWLKVDVAFKVQQQGIYMFCREIEEAKIEQ